MALDVFVQAFQTEKDFIGQVVVCELAFLERRDEVDVEVPLGLGCGAIVRRTKEQVTDAIGTALLPFDLVLPDLKT